MAINLKAENLAISVPIMGCNKNCPYCVSRMTGYMESDFKRMKYKAEKVKTVARAAEITSVLLTGKGEPTIDKAFHMTVELLGLFKEWPCELQTNGIILNEHPEWLNHLYLAGLDVLAVSIDSDKQLVDYKPLWDELKRLKMVSRITVNVTQLMGTINPTWWINKCSQMDINQLTFRRVTIPEICKDKKTSNWIGKNAPDFLYNDIVQLVNDHIAVEGRLIRTLKNGVLIWDINDVAVVTSDYCIQEKDEGDNLRSLVYQEDGHLYTGWGSKASILF